MHTGKLRFYHANANRCSRWASEASDDENRQAFLDVRRKWRAMALKETPAKPSAPNQLCSPIRLSVKAA